MLILVAGYVFYGRWLCKQWGVGESSEQTPAHTMEDGVDYVPAKAPILMGHHFSSIAGAGPIGEIISANMSKRAKRLFIIFAYLTLILVVAAFACIVAGTFGAACDANGVLDVAASTSQARVAMAFMLFVTIASLLLNTWEKLQQIAAGGADWGPYVQCIFGVLLVVLAIVLAIEVVVTIWGQYKEKTAAK